MSDFRFKKQDFGVEADRHYYVSAHDKSCYDGIGLTFKQEASLTGKPQDVILTFETLLKWAKKHPKLTDVLSSNKQYHEKITKQLKKKV